MEIRRYPTDLSDDEWRCIGPHLPNPTGRGRPRIHGLWAILDAVFYVLKSGSPLRQRALTFRPWLTGGQRKRRALSKPYREETIENDGGEDEKRSKARQ